MRDANRTQTVGRPDAEASFVVPSVAAETSSIPDAPATPAQTSIPAHCATHAVAVFSMSTVSFVAMCITLLECGVVGDA